MEQEILDTLKCHEELLSFDASDVLRLKERHRATKLKTNVSVKGHTLSEKTMRIAVSVINISIYLNPTLSFLVKPAIATVAIGLQGTELGNITIYFMNCVSQHVTNVHTILMLLYYVQVQHTSNMYY